MKKKTNFIDINIKPGLCVAHSKAWIKGVAETVLSCEKVTYSSTVDLFITDDKQIHRMNRLYRGMDSPTDVLSFALQDKASKSGDIVFSDEHDGIVNLGEIIISYPRVISQASEYGVTVDEELSLLIVHGMLHLLGYDHMEDADARKMRRREKAILKRIFKEQ